MLLGFWPAEHIHSEAQFDAGDHTNILKILRFGLLGSLGHRKLREGCVFSSSPNSALSLLNSSVIWISHFARMPSISVMEPEDTAVQ